jgi:DNA-binding transcriptional MerR regulator
MTNANLLNEAESAKFASVSVETITQYIEFGLIKPVSKNSQGLLFDRDDLAQTFHIFQNANLDPSTIKETNTNLNEAPKSTLLEKIEVSSDKAEQVDNLPAIRDVELIQLNRQLRDQLRSLSQERDWLKERLEKLEERSEREQMLLISTSQTIRELMQNKKPGYPGFLSFLNWFKN